MGATCAPGEGEENVDEENRDMEGGEEEPNEKFAKIINDYQVENERLKGELDNLQNQNEEGVEEREEKARKNEEVIRELAEMKETLEKKNRAIVRGRLEAALLSKATSMLTLESKTRLCMDGEIRHHYKRNKKKNKFAEIHLNAGEVLSTDFKMGYVMMTYSDRKDAQTSNRCQVLNVTADKSTKKDEHPLTINASIEGAVKKITFSCETVEQRDAWVKALMDALAEVKTTYDDMHALFTLKLEFAKEKMGIRVEEKLLEYSEDEKKVEVEDKPKGKKDEKKPKESEKAVEAVKDEKKCKDDEKEEVKKNEQPCELLVTNISDDDLTAAGLVVNCVVREINDTLLTGMVYSDQLQLLQQTEKPYILTFTGQNFLKHKAEPKHGYLSIMKELLADGDNVVKRAFNELVAGTPFQTELDKSADKKATIQKLLSNQRRLMALLQNFTVQQIDL